MALLKKLFLWGLIAGTGLSLTLAFLLYNIEKEAVRVTLTSTEMTEDRPVTIYLPSNYANQTTQRYPVIYTVDGERIRNSSLAVLSGRIVTDKEFILVAIDMIGQRGRDLRRKDAKAFDRNTSGEAAKFLNFIEKELIPHVEATYRTSEERILAGHSYGGMFSVHTMTLRPHLFDGYLAFSPALNADDRSLEMLERFFASEASMSKRLYMNLGWETYYEYDVRFEEAKALIRRRKPDNFHFDSHRYWIPHGAVPIPGYLQGLSFYFADKSSN